MVDILEGFAQDFSIYKYSKTRTVIKIELNYGFKYKFDQDHEK